MLYKIKSWQINRGQNVYMKTNIFITYNKTFGTLFDMFSVTLSSHDKKANKLFKNRRSLQLFLYTRIEPTTLSTSDRLFAQIQGAPFEKLSEKMAFTF